MVCLAKDSLHTDKLVPSQQSFARTCTPATGRTEVEQCKAAMQTKDRGSRPNSDQIMVDPVMIL